jgi:hypothetical protein
MRMVSCWRQYRSCKLICGIWRFPQVRNRQKFNAGARAWLAAVETALVAVPLLMMLRRSEPFD